jgi:hypothetical protein
MSFICLVLAPTDVQQPIYWLYSSISLSVPDLYMPKYWDRDNGEPSGDLLPSLKHTLGSIQILYTVAGYHEHKYGSATVGPYCNCTQILDYGLDLDILDAWMTRRVSMSTIIRLGEAKRMICRWLAQKSSLFFG